MANRITSSDLVKMDRLVIPGTWAAEAIGMDKTKFFNYAREDLDRPIGNKRIPFPCQVSGNRVKVPRIPFLRYLGVTDEEIAEKRLR